MDISKIKKIARTIAIGSIALAVNAGLSYLNKN